MTAATPPPFLTLREVSTYVARLFCHVAPRRSSQSLPRRDPRLQPSMALPAVVARCVCRGIVISPVNKTKGRCRMSAWHSVIKAGLCRMVAWLPMYRAQRIAAAVVRCLWPPFRSV